MALRLASRRVATNVSAYSRIATSESRIQRRNATAMAVPTSALSDEIRHDISVGPLPNLSLYLE